ncbi:MAG: TIGR03960 family B12-binding radical SAM protein [Negativicutes bacterium]|jgi:radical SAM family uncharacterized protein
MKNLQKYLNLVAKPGRYVGGEYNSVVKNLPIDLRFAFAFPDTYEVGMSHLGSQLLYSIINAREDTWCERVYCPWLDFETVLRDNSVPLYALESKAPIADFDILGITLQYELTYTNVLNMLDLAQLPLRSNERDETMPLVVGGGPCVYNPEPVADFFDCFLIGEGEEAVNDICDCVIKWKKSEKAGGKTALLSSLSKIQGVYVPALGKHAVVKRVCQDLDESSGDIVPIVPNIGIIHERAMLEIFRGCTRGCRFCQAGFVYRPVRERRLENVCSMAKQLLASSGYDEIALTSLSSADYSHITEAVQCVQQDGKERISVSLPSLRMDSFSVNLAKLVQNVRKGSMTFAPEAGTQRMRDIINKNVTDEDIDAALSAAFAAGCRTVKLYFMIGLPLETDTDVNGIIDTAKRVERLYRSVTGKGGVKITVSVSNFVPKAQTPFQREKQNTAEEFSRKHGLLREAARSCRAITLRYHDASTSCLEGAFARGGRELSAVIESAWSAGAKFDGWSEMFKYSLWRKAFEANGLNLDEYLKFDYQKDTVLPWTHISAGVNDEYFALELQKASSGQPTKDCRRADCTGCGVCQKLAVKVVDWGNS